MKGNNLVKKTIAFTAVAAMCSSLAVVAEAADDGVIQFSPAKMKITNPDGSLVYSDMQSGGSGLPDGITGVVTSNKNNENKYGTAASKWSAAQFQFHNSNGYEGGYYMNSQCSDSNSNWTVTISLENIPAGMYDFDQFLPGGSLAPKNHTDYCSITVTTQADEQSQKTVYEGEHNFCDANLGTFNNITDTDIPLEGNVTITYYVPGGKLPAKYDSTGKSNRTLRLDEIRLTKTGEIPVTAQATHQKDFETENKSVWDATVDLNGGTYTTVSATAVSGQETKTSDDVSLGTTVTGDGSAYFAVVVNKLESELDSVSVTVK